MTDDGRLECRFCPDFGRRAYAVWRRHMDQLHPHICYYCNWNGTDQRAWLRHLRRDHPLTELVNEQMWRWVYGWPSFNVLHRLAEMTACSDHSASSWGFTSRACTGIAACGYVPAATEGGGFTPEGLFFMPGIVSRMGLRRCAKCCDKVGVPRGRGTPWNQSDLPDELRIL